MANEITAEDIRQGICENYRSMFRVTVAPVGRAKAMPIVDAFWRAVRIVCPLARAIPALEIVFGPSPFTIQGHDGGRLTYEQPSGPVNTTLGNAIFLNTDKMATLPQEELLGYVIHELIHAIFNIADEPLVMALQGYLCHIKP